MDIVLVNPADLSSPYPPMGLVELGTFLKAEGYSVGIVDFSLEGKKKGIKILFLLILKLLECLFYLAPFSKQMKYLQRFKKGWIVF